MQLILAVILTINLSAPDYWVLHHDETIAASYYGPKDFKEKLLGSMDSEIKLSYIVIYTYLIF